MTHPKLNAWLTSITLLCISSTALAVDYYKIDPEHTSVIFGASHVGLSFTYGFFRDVSGQYKIDESNPANCAFQLLIRADSLDTNNAERDKHLRSSDFFNVQEFPDITFLSTQCERVATDDRSVVYKVVGDLKMHGVTRPVQLNLRMLAKKPGATGNDMRTGFLCSKELKRSEFKMTNLLDDGKVGDAVAVTISFEGAQQPPPAGAPANR
jgi:polyisoprenoid-binding protein YceI